MIAQRAKLISHTSIDLCAFDQPTYRFAHLIVRCPSSTIHERQSVADLTDHHHIIFCSSTSNVGSRIQ